MARKKHFTRVVRFWCILAIGGIALLLVAINAVNIYTNFITEADSIRAEYMTQQKKMLKREVRRIVEAINHQRQLCEKEIRQTIKNRATEAFNIAQTLYQNRRSHQDDEQIKSLILSMLKPFNFVQTHATYIVVEQDVQLLLYECQTQKKHSTGMQTKNPKKASLPQLPERLAYSEDGFYHYEMPEHADDRRKTDKKLAYFCSFKPFNWLIGAEVNIRNYDHHLQTQLLTFISKMRFGGEGYFFVNHFNGDGLIVNGAVTDGTKKLWEYPPANAEKIRAVFQMEYDAAMKPDGDYILYDWPKLNNLTRDAAKTSYIYGISDWQWIIGAGVYLDSINKDIESLQKKLQIIIYKEIVYVVFTVIVIISLLLVLFNHLNSQLKNDYRLFNSFFNTAIHSGAPINRDLLSFAEWDAVAANANTMLAEKTQAEQALRDERERLFVTIQSIGDGVIATDLNGTIVLINRVAEEMTGYTAASAIGSPLQDIFVIVNARTGKPVDNPVTKVIASGHTIGLGNHTQLNSHCGNTYQISDSAAPIRDADGNISGVVLVFSDMTTRIEAEKALQESEARSSALLNAIPDLIFILDKDGTFLDYHASHPELLLMLPGDFIGKKMDDILPVTTVSKAKKLIQQSAATGKMQVLEYTLLIDDKQEFFEAQLVPYYATKILAIVRNITHRKQIEDEQHKIEKLKSIGTLAGGIAHDFNNILMGLFGNISMAKEEIAQNNPGYRYLEESEKAMSRAKRLTKQLLTFSKGGSPVKENVSIDKLVEDIVLFDLSGSNIKPVIQRQDHLWMAMADKGQVQQIFSNLIINARQAMPEGGHLYIFLENCDIIAQDIAGPDIGQYIKIQIKDEGMGISKKHLDRIFDPYFTTKQSGSGLGLATVYSIIKKHDGHIHVTSEPGNGSCFTFYLPAASHATPTHKNADTSAPLQKSPAGTILVMDDETLICDVASAMLEKSGFTVKTALDGQTAVDMYKAAYDAGDPFDAVIMDLTIPGGKGGKEAVKELLYMHPDARVIVSSGYTNDPILANYRDYGFKAIIEKPYTMKKLQTVMANVLNGSEKT